MDGHSILAKHNIPTNLTVHHAIVTVSELLDSTPDFFGTANAIITDLGGSKQDDAVRARLFAKSLVEQAYCNKDYNPDAALTIATEKVEKIAERIPFLFKEKKESFKQSALRASRQVSDKKVKALQLFNDHPRLTTGERAKLISVQLDITYANAYYYARSFANAQSE